MSSSIYQLCPTTIAEKDDIVALEIESFPLDEAASPETVLYRLTEAGTYFYTYRHLDGKELAGFVNGTCIRGDKISHESMTHHDQDGRSLVIHSVTIKESLRRRKLGTAMLKAYVSRMKDEMSLDSLLLLSKANLLPFYIDCGFQVMRLSDISHGQVCITHNANTMPVLHKYYDSTYLILIHG